MDPLGRPRPLHAPLSITEPLNLREVPREPETQAPALGTASGRICILVHQNIYLSIGPGLDQYEADLNAAGYKTIVSVYTSGNPEDIRAYLAGLYGEPGSLTGAVFIGDIPYIIYEMMQTWGGNTEYEDFPCDIFFMDLDGTWSDTLNDGEVQPGNGKYDTRGGNRALEIWVSRIKAGNLPSLGLESSILKKYFDKNHRYRTGALAPAQKALVFNDDDWSGMAPEDAGCLAQVYGTPNVTKVSDREETTATDYKSNRMTADYELMFIRSHGYPGGHGFYQDNRSSFQTVYCADYRDLDPKGLFYSLYVCSGTDYTADDYLAGTIAFNMDDSGLLAWGSTKTGGILNDTYFYTPLSDGEVFGESFRQWFNSVQAFYPAWAPQWWYGMVLIGDGALKPILTADFTADPTNGEAPLAVTFTDLSIGNIASWRWVFGDGAGSTLRNPAHTYTKPGTYDVTLTVIQAGRSDTKTKKQYIAAQAGIERYESISALASGSPDSVFPVQTLPWDDPDNVLADVTPPLLFYRAPAVSGAIFALKSGATVRIE
jgi:hypothetical protein